MYYDRVYLCEGQKWDLEREVRKRDYEVQEKWKAATTANNARRKRATAGSHVSFDHFLLTLPALLRVYQTDKGTPPRSLSSRCLSFSAQPPFCTYVSLSIVVLSFTMFFLVENTLAARTQVRSGARANGNGSHWRRRVEETLDDDDDDDFATLWIFVILISPASII